MQSGTSSVNNRPNGWPIKLGGRGAKSVERLPDRPEKRLSDHREAQSEEQRTVADAKPLPPPTMTRLPPFPPATQTATFPACTAPAARYRPSLPPSSTRPSSVSGLHNLFTAAADALARSASSSDQVQALRSLPVPLASYPPHSHRCPRHLALCPPPPLLHRATLARPPRATEAKRLLTG